VSINLFVVAGSGIQQGRNEGVKGAQFPVGRITMGASNSPNNVKITFFNTANLLLNDIRFEYGDAKLVS